MKRFIIVAAMFTVISGSLFSQEDVNEEAREKMQLGIKAGANYSNVWDIKGQDFTADFKFGFVGGVYLGIPIGKYLGVRPEVLYSQKGYQSSGNILGASYKITHSADYIDVPLLLEIKPTEYMTVVAGPEYSYLVRTKNDFSSSFLTTQQEQDFDNTNLRKNTLSFLAGLDFNLGHIVLEPRFGFDLLRNNGDGTSTNPRYRNLWYQATLNFRF